MDSHYTYAEGYVAPKGTGRLIGEEKDDLRLVSILRLVDQSEVPKQRARKKAS